MHKAQRIKPTLAHAAPAAVLRILPLLLQDQERLQKLLTVLPMHRIMVILITCNPADYVLLPCLQVISMSLNSQYGSTFQKRLEAEGGFVLLAKNLAPIWDREVEDIGKSKASRLIETRRLSFVFCFSQCSSSFLVTAIQSPQQAAL